MAFKDWLATEYAIYQKSVLEKLIAFYDALNTADKQAAFETYIREHHNNAFDDEAGWEANIKAQLIYGELTPTAFEVLEQCIESPKFDGDVVSKNGKAECYSHGLLVRIANNNEFGDNAATYLGWLVFSQREKHRKA